MQSATISHLQPAKSTELIAECRKLACTRLPDSLKIVLNRVDDTLFELANTADNSNRQNLYFDAMRELRQKRENFESAFMQSFNANFENSLDLDKAKRDGQAFATSAELSLVDADDVEQSLAVTNLAEGMRSHYREELFALDKRIGVLLRVPDLDDADNPLGPRAIGDALRQACQCLESGLEIKLTLFKLFEKFAGNAIYELYQDINQRLVASDVLPRVASQVTRPEGGKRKTRVIIESEQDSVEAAGEDVFSTLQHLMQNYSPAVRAHNHGSAASAGVTGGSAGTGSVPLVQTLTALQRGYGGSEGDDSVWSRVDADQVAAGNVNVLHGLRETGALTAMGRTDELTLDIVSLLFDYILDDPAIPDGLKALIGRLQLPVFKVAILDKGVFSKKTHPARRLLDELAASSISWSEGLRQQDALYDEIEHVVRRIVTEFDDNVALFEEVLADFLAFRESETNAAEERARQSTQSLNARERVVQVKMEVDEEISTRFADFEIREFVGNFILDYWRQLLIITLIESGRASDAWQWQLQTVDDLVWSIQPKTTPADRKTLTALDLGDWVEFEKDDGTSMRARFTWISPNSGRYLFTTRQGKRALDTTLQDLAGEFRRGRAKVIESAPDPLFDRAIGDLIDKLGTGDAVL